MISCKPSLRKLTVLLTRWPKEAVAIYFAIVFFPTMIAVGAVIDYSRSKNYQTAMQAALEAAVLSGGRDGSASWTQVALKIFKANLSSRFGPLPKPTFSLDPTTGNYIGTVTATLPTSILGILNISSLDVTAAAAAVADDDISFILTVDHAPPKSPLWSVSGLSGDALLMSSAGEQAALADGIILKPGNKIRTGQNGRVLLTRGQETILIASNSVIGIPLHVTEGMSTTIHQWAGSILLAVEKQDDKHFDVVTPYLTAVVRGTRFRVNVNQNDASVEVLRGQVEVADFKSGQYALVLPGQAAKVMAEESAGLWLSGAGTLSPILRGPPRKSSVSLEALSAPPSSERISQRENSSNYGINALRRLFGNSEARRSPNEDATFAIAFACGIGVIVTFIVAIRRRRRKWE